MVMMAAGLWLLRKGLALGQDFIHVLNIHIHNYNLRCSSSKTRFQSTIQKTEMNQAHKTLKGAVTGGGDQFE